MAIYRKGEASLAADGTVTGYGTNWKDQLALVRIGATVVFLTGNAISAIGTVSAIVSETQLQTIQTDGAVVARGKYFILLHDSLTVDGLAQNVAETLRYYQSQETEIAEAIDYFRTFDWDKFENIANSVKTNAAAAKVSETNAKTSETNSKASENASAASKDAAAASAAAAKTSETNSKTSETNSKASENAANGSKVAAAGSATAADASAKAGAASQAAAKTSETNAKTSETNAKASENASLQSKNAAAGSATAAKTSETNAKTSETRSKTSETNSAASAVTATNEADRAKREADRAAAANPDNSLLKANNLSDVPDKVKARDNLNVGYNDIFTVSQLRARNGLITTTESNANNDNPSAPFVNQLLDSSGAVISQGEFRADRNGNVSIINRVGSPQFASLSQNGDFAAPNFIASNGFEGSKVELGQRRPNQIAYIDLHFGAKYDYDARIFCDGMNSDQNGGGNLRMYAGYTHINSKGSTNIDGGRLTVNTTDVNINTKLAVTASEGSIIIRPSVAGNAHYMLFNDLSKNTGYIGNPSNSNDSMVFHNYTHSCNITLSDRIRLLGKDTEVAANLYVTGSSVYVSGGAGNSNTHLWLQNSSGRNRAVVYSNDNQVLNLRSDNVGTGASGQALSINGATGECRATTFTNTSDERAKFWLKPVSSALDKLCQLRGVTYSMHTTIQDTVRKAGVIAQDVKKVLPEAVSETDYKGVLDKECREIENPLGVDYSALSALYVEAFKELKTMNDEKSEKIAKLESDVEDLKAMVAALIAK